MKHKMKRLLNGFLAVLMAISIINFNGIVTKANSPNVSEESVSSWTYKGLTYGTGQILRLDGEIAFCLEGDKAAHVGANDIILPEDIGLSQDTMDQLALIVWYGYRINPSTTNYFLTQNLVWKYLGYNSYAVSSEYPSLSSQQSWFDSVMYKVNHFFEYPSFNWHTYEVNVNETLEITDTNGILTDLSIKSVSGATVTKNGNTLYVTPDSDSEDELTIKFNRGMSTAQTETNFVVRNGKSQAVSKCTGQDPYTASVNIKVNKLGSLEITKKDDRGNFVPGTSFLLSYDADMSTSIGTYTTGDDGKVKVDDLLPQTVYVKETAVPSYLKIDPTVRNVSIIANETAEYKPENKWITGTINIVKEDQDTGAKAQGDATLDGAVYGLYANENIINPQTGTVVYKKDALITTLTTTDRKASANINYLGSMYLKEITAPVGYNLSSTKYPVVFEYNNQNIEVVVKEQTVKDKVITQPLEIYKKDVDTGNAVEVAGAVFGVYTKIGTKIATVTTDKKGKATVASIPYGKDYYFVEEKAPEKYTLNDEKVYFDVTTDGVTIKKSLSNKRVTGTINITKLDDEYGEQSQGDAKLDGTKIGVFAKNDILAPDNGTVKFKAGALVKELIIKDNKASVANLYLGDYYVKEKTPGEGYLLSTQQIDVSLTYKDQNTAVIVREAELENKVKTQAFRIAKFTTNGEPGPAPALKGAEFTYILESHVKEFGSYQAAVNAAKSGNEKIKSTEWGVMTCDEQGMATSKRLPYGRYRVHESKVPTGMSASSDFFVEITEDSNTPQNWIYVNDPHYETVLAIVKLDAETGNTVKLAGTKFKVKCLSDNADFKAGDYVGWWVWSPLPEYKNTFETTEDGTVMLPNPLSPGTYQLEEIESPLDYLLPNSNSKPFTIAENDIHQQVGPDNSTIVTTVTFEDYAVKGQMKIDKQAELFKGYKSEETEYGPLYTPIYEKGLLPNVKFEVKAYSDIIGKDGMVWYHSGELIETLTTDGKKITTSSLLPIGTDNIYTVQEVQTEEGYVLDDTIRYFRFDYLDNKTPVVSATWLDKDGNEVDQDTLTMNNDKQTSIAVAKKKIESSDLKENDDAFKDVTFGCFTENVTGLAKDSLVGLSGIDQEGNLDFELTQKGNYYLKEVATDHDHVLPNDKYPFAFSYLGDKVHTIKINDGDPIYNYLKRGSIEIWKKDMESGLPMVNVRYDLATDKEFKNILKTTATSETGYVLFEELEANQTYYIREHYNEEHDMVVEGYVYDPTVHEVHIGEDKQVITLELTNQQVKGKFQFTKTGETFTEVELVDGEFGTEHHPIWKQGNLLGATLTVEAAEDITTWDGVEWYKKGDIVTTLESDWDMVDSILLPVGKYKAYEAPEGTPHGYINDPTIYNFEITANGLAEIQLNPITINNNRAKVDFDFIKQLEEQEIVLTPEAYQDIVFGLYAREDIYDYMGNVAIENGSLIGISEINEEGHLTNTYDLPIGTYYFEELQTNEQYVLLDKEFDFAIEYQGAGVQEYTIPINDGEIIYNLLKRASIEIQKVDIDSTLPLVNVEYELATDKEFTNIIKTTSTSEDGKALFEELEVNKMYYVREHYDGEHDMVLEGYVYDPTIYEVYLEDNEQIITLALTNQQVKGKVQFTKTGETFTEVEFVDGPYGTEHHPTWKQGNLLGATLTIEAAEDITTWDGVDWYKKGDIVAELESDWETVESVLLPVGKYKAYETIEGTPHGYINDPTIHEFEITPNGLAEIQLNPITINNNRAKVNLDFTKTMEKQSIFVNPEAYQDIVFGLYAREDIYDYMGNVAIENGSLIGISEIDEEGHLTNTYDLPIGTYYFKELSSNEQYVLLDKEFDFAVEYQGAEVKEYTIEINEGEAIENKLIKGSIEVIKFTEDDVYYSKAENKHFKDQLTINQSTWRNPLLQEDRNYLIGVAFELSTDANFENIIKTGYTDDTGRIVFQDLERGEYFIREKNSLDFYTLKDEIYTVKIERNGQFETIEVGNNLIESYVNVKKVDAGNHEVVLSGAEFTLYADAECTQELKKEMTAKEGIAHFGNLKFGSTVYIKETKAPSGYEMSSEIIKVEIDEAWVSGTPETRIVTFTNEKIPPVTPNTGDTTSACLYLSLTLMSAASLLMLTRKRKEH